MGACLLSILTLLGTSAIQYTVMPIVEFNRALYCIPLQVRAHVNSIKARLEGGLAALAAAAFGSAAFTAEHLEDMAPLAAPLLASPLVGEDAAWAAIRAMAAALPRGLGAAATAVATAQRLVALQEATGMHQRRCYDACPTDHAAFQHSELAMAHLGACN